MSEKAVVLLFTVFLVACAGVSVNQRLAESGYLISSVANLTQTALEAEEITADRAQEVLNILTAAQEALDYAVFRAQSGYDSDALVYLNVATKAIEEAILLKEMP